MDSVDLTSEQIERLFVRLDRDRQFLERLHAQISDTGFPASDPLRIATADTLRSVRELVMVLNDSRRKGLCRQFIKRAKAWPKV